MAHLASFIQIPGVDPAMIVIIAAVVLGALVCTLLLILDGLGVNRARLRHNQPVAPMAAAAAHPRPTVTTQTPQRVREAVGSQA